MTIKHENLATESDEEKARDVVDAVFECPSCKVHPHRQACTLNCEDARVADAFTRGRADAIAQAAEVARKLERPPTPRFAVRFIDHIQGSNSAEWECKNCGQRWASPANLECPYCHNNAEEPKITDADASYNQAAHDTLAAILALSPDASYGDELWAENEKLKRKSETQGANIAALYKQRRNVEKENDALRTRVSELERERDALIEERISLQSKVAMNADVAHEAIMASGRQAEEFAARMRNQIAERVKGYDGWVGVTTQKLAAEIAAMELAPKELKS